MSTAWIGIQWTDVVAFVVLILILLFRPTGILGERLGVPRERAAPIPPAV